MTRKQFVTRTEIAKMAGDAKTHFLNPEARRQQKSLGDVAGLTKLGFHLIEVPIGSVSGEFHRHYCEEECVFILEGTGTARIGESIMQVEAGDFIAYPAGSEAHDLRNTGSVTLKYIIAGQRLDYDITDYPERGKRLYRAKGRDWDLLDLAMISKPDAGA